MGDSPLFYPQSGDLILDVPFTGCPHLVLGTVPMTETLAQRYLPWEEKRHTGDFLFIVVLDWRGRVGGAGPTAGPTSSRAGPLARVWIRTHDCRISDCARAREDSDWLTTRVLPGLDPDEEGDQ